MMLEPSLLQHYLLKHWLRSSKSAIDVGVAEINMLRVSSDPVDMEEGSHDPNDESTTNATNQSLPAGRYIMWGHVILHFLQTLQISLIPTNSMQRLIVMMLVKMK